MNLASMNTTACRDKNSWHPLLLIPVFRRVPRFPGRDLLFTAVWSLGIGSLFLGIQLLIGSRAPIAKLLASYAVISLSIGGLFHLIYVLLDRLSGGRLFDEQRGPWLWLVHGLIAFASVTGGMTIGHLILGLSLDGLLHRGTLVGAGLSAGTLSVIIGLIFMLQRNEARSEAVLARERERAAQLERHALEAQLRMLQAQVEPHFLYNTLANVVGLIGPQPDTARRMLERLIDYLRATLSVSRQAETTLDDELRVARAYLELIQIRMGARLTVDFAVDEGLGHLPLPPMLIQPLVENAIQHGLEPKVDGGRIEISARREPGQLVLTVRDNGVGFGAATQRKTDGGVGLTNLRERLAARFGPNAGCRITESEEGGVCVTLRLPLIDTGY